MAGSGQDASHADVRWFAPVRASDRRAHAEWCGTVGPVVFNRSEFLPPRTGALAGTGAAASGLDRLAVISWNTHVGGADLPRLVRKLRAGGFSGGVPVTDFVLLLQEVFRSGSDVPALVGESPPVPDAIVSSPPSGPRTDVVAAARELGVSVFYAPSMRNGAGRGGAREDRGNAILSTLPLSDLRVIELPFEKQRRVAVAATVDIESATGPAWRLRVISAHLDNRATRRRLFVFAPQARTRQARGLLEALPADEPAVLGGDFNTWLGGGEGTIRQLTRRFPDTPEAAGATMGFVRVDHLFFRLPNGWRAESRVVDDPFGSDHRPVLGWVRSGGS